MTIDLTPEELREFVRLWRTEPRSMAETSALRKLERRIPTFLPTTLALALADAMEERDEARKAITYATESLLDYDDAEWAAWNAMPAVRAALGKDSDGDD